MESNVRATVQEAERVHEEEINGLALCLLLHFMQRESKPRRLQRLQFDTVDEDEAKVNRCRTCDTSTIVVSGIGDYYGIVWAEIGSSSFDCVRHWRLSGGGGDGDIGNQWEGEVGVIAETFL
ncbi:hypothetical protein PV325_008364 [Microctonus aethiopoides]|nr:hypothetical protein PV325_008364 [Microctonus aethiopoides]